VRPSTIRFAEAQDDVDPRDTTRKAVAPFTSGAAMAYGGAHADRDHQAQH
jgi:hypothetical protein